MPLPVQANQTLSAVTPQRSTRVCVAPGSISPGRDAPWARAFGFALTFYPTVAAFIWLAVHVLR